mmetsp:Transcript_12822/g.45223  ORF Transcript_12822/g.45223 Transcript_12822/m.45223 type:complete len:295 (-) Transcript_12822:292-1176(-)
MGCREGPSKRAVSTSFIENCLEGRLEDSLEVGWKPSRGLEEGRLEKRLKSRLKDRLKGPSRGIVSGGHLLDRLKGRLQGPSPGPSLRPSAGPLAVRGCLQWRGYGLNVGVAVFDIFRGRLDLVLDLVDELALLFCEQRKVDEHLVQLRDGLLESEDVLVLVGDVGEGGLDGVGGALEDRRLEDGLGAAGPQHLVDFVGRDVGFHDFELPFDRPLDRRLVLRLRQLIFFRHVDEFALQSASQIVANPPFRSLSSRLGSPSRLRHLHEESFRALHGAVRRVHERRELVGEGLLLGR